MNVPLRSSLFLAGRAKAVMPKIKLYESEVDHLRLKIAVDHGFMSWDAYSEARRKETESFYVNVMGCK